MQSTITARGQTVIPAVIRHALGLGPSHKLEWLMGPDGIRVVPVKTDPIAAFRGTGRGGSVQRLLADRAAERD